MIKRTHSDLKVQVYRIYKTALAGFNRFVGIKSTKAAGQAVIEYIVIFAFMSLIGLSFVRGITGILSNTLGTLGYALTHELSIGVCPTACFMDSYDNRID